MDLRVLVQKVLSAVPLRVKQESVGCPAASFGSVLERVPSLQLRARLLAEVFWVRVALMCLMAKGLIREIREKIVWKYLFREIFHTETNLLKEERILARNLFVPNVGLINCIKLSTVHKLAETEAVPLALIRNIIRQPPRPSLYRRFLREQEKEEE